MRNFWLSNAMKVGDVVEYTGYLTTKNGTRMTVNAIEGELVECVWFEGTHLRIAVIKRRFLKHG